MGPLNALGPPTQDNMITVLWELKLKTGLKLISIYLSRIFIVNQCIQSVLSLIERVYQEFILRLNLVTILKKSFLLDERKEIMYIRKKSESQRFVYPSIWGDIITKWYSYFFPNFCFIFKITYSRGLLTRNRTCTIKV